MRVSAPFKVDLCGQTGRRAPGGLAIQTPAGRQLRSSPAARPPADCPPRRAGANSLVFLAQVTRGSPQTPVRTAPNHIAAMALSRALLAAACVLAFACMVSARHWRVRPPRARGAGGGWAGAHARAPPAARPPRRPRRRPPPPPTACSWPPTSWSPGTVSAGRGGRPGGAVWPRSPPDRAPPAARRDPTACGRSRARRRAPRRRRRRPRAPARPAHRVPREEAHRVGP
jgi:hypothetical protein